MIPLFDISILKTHKSIDELPFKCTVCEKTFYVKKRIIQGVINNVSSRKLNYCGKPCQTESQKFKVNVKCTNCDKEIKKTEFEIKKSKTGNLFCSRSCSATYNNTHKTKGNRRSKLEIYLENELKLLYPDLKMDFNKTDTIDSELDIYIPSFKLAIELNGIFHYEPIYGQNKLIQIQNNDNRKYQACIERGIELCIIDTFHQKYFKEHSSKKFLNIILEIINTKNKMSLLDSNQQTD